MPRYAGRAMTKAPALSLPPATVAPDPATVERLQRSILDWYAENGRDLPWRRTRHPYAVLVSEIMLQQTQVSRVVPRYEAYMRRFPDLDTLAASPLADVLAEWSGLGYNNRAERLRRCAQTLVTAGAELPSTLEELMALPGIGRYTAGAVLVFAHNADVAAVDANVRRVLTHELDLPHDLPPAALQAVAEAVLPRGRSRDWHNALMDYGALVLTGRATGIAARTRQGPFPGSRRWWRSRILRLVLAEGDTSVTALERETSLAREQLDEILALLAHDRLLERDGEMVRLP